MLPALLPGRLRARAVSPTAYDRYWGNVSSLLHMDGSNGSTTFTDETGKAWSLNNNAQISTAQSRYSGASCKFDASSSIECSHADFAFGNDPFTIEGYVYWTNPTGVTQRGCLQWCTAGGLSTSDSTTLAIYPGSGDVWAIYGGGGWSVSSTVISAATWYHFMLTRAGSGSGRTLRLFVNGVEVLSKADTVNYTGTGAVLGAYHNTNYYFDGYLDEVRVTKGVARATANFAPPVQTFLSQ